MPYLRRRRSTRRPIRRRPRMMRRRYPIRKRLSRRPKVHLFKRSFHTTITILKSSNTAGCNYFTLDQLPNYTEFTSLYDQYKVNGLKYEFIPRFNSIDQTAGTGGEFYTAIDRTDNNSPSTLNELLEYQSMRKSPLTRKHTRYFKPGVPTAVFASTDDPANSVLPIDAIVKLSPWITTDAPSTGGGTSNQIQHLGLKFWCSATNASSNTVVDVICTSYLAMRTVK